MCAIKADWYFRLLTILTHTPPPNPQGREPWYEGYIPPASYPRIACNEWKNLSFYLPLLSDARQSRISTH
jgi:hypothetical protein